MVQGRAQPHAYKQPHKRSPPPAPYMSCESLSHKVQITRAMPSPAPTSRPTSAVHHRLTAQASTY